MTEQQYRPLEAHEVIEEGDEWKYNFHDTGWFKCGEIMLGATTTGTPSLRNRDFRRPIPTAPAYEVVAIVSSPDALTAMAARAERAERALGVAVSALNQIQGHHERRSVHGDPALSPHYENLLKDALTQIEAIQKTEIEVK